MTTATLIAFVLGLMIGGLMGFVVAAVFNAGAEADRRDNGGRP